MRLKHIDALRGIAALSVTLFHLTSNSGLSTQTKRFGDYGYLGVDLFFVISGFVLPYSLYQANYRLVDFPVFLLKRLIRIYPPYLIAMVISILLAFLTNRAVLPWPGIVLHLVFLNQNFGYPFISPVFWTLAIEFQFYLLLGLLFQHVVNHNWRSIILGGCMFGGLLFNHVFFQTYPFFTLGILIYNKKVTNLNTVVYYLLSLTIIVIIGLTSSIYDAIAGGVAILFIIFLKPEYFDHGLGRVYLWLGSISYSLYLMHWELGRATIAFLRHIPVLKTSEILKVIAGLSVSLIFSYLLYWYIEKPAIRLSHKISYKKLLVYKSLKEVDRSS